MIRLHTIFYNFEMLKIKFNPAFAANMANNVMWFQAALSLQNAMNLEAPQERLFKSCQYLKEKKLPVACRSLAVELINPGS